MSNYGYARVSSHDQHEERQLIALKKAGIEAENIYLDKQSGSNFDRPGWKRLLRKLRKGDLLVIQSLDRLGRNYKETLMQWRQIVEQRKAHIRVLDMPMLDTMHGNIDMIRELMSDLVLHLFSYIADNERTRIRERQAQGIAAAKARGVKFGRRRCELPEDFEYYAQRVHAGQLSLRTAAQRCGLSLATFHRRLNEFTFTDVFQSARKNQKAILPRTH